jgi:hypothetical protein
VIGPPYSVVRQEIPPFDAMMGSRPALVLTVQQAELFERPLVNVSTSPVGELTQVPLFLAHDARRLCIRIRAFRRGQ